MESLYNAKVSFKGEGSFTFTLPKYGELTVYRGRDIFIKGLNVSGVELLRQLRPLLLEHKLNSKPDGCYMVIDLAKDSLIQKKFERAYKEPVKEQTVADLKASLIKSNGPIVEEEIKEEIEEEVDVIVDEIVEEDTIDYGAYILTSSKHKGKELKALTKQQIKSNMARFNDKDKTAISLYLESIK